MSKLLKRHSFFIYVIQAGIIFILFNGCNRNAKTLLNRISPGKSGVSFNNNIPQTDSFNIISDEYIYNGGGVGVGDFNNDGLEDLYFAGNKVSNKLYLNKGNFRFEDVTDKAGVGAGDIWSSGIAVVDINNDGWPDIYVSATFNHSDGTRKNKLFINQGLKNGIPVFIDKAHEFGIDDDGYTTQAVFFDYDLDGDLDLYLLNNVFLGKRSMSNEPNPIQNKALTIDKLYRNNGDGTFTDVSAEAGIVNEGFGLGIAVLDINKDGYPDLYISNDFVSSDILYVNNGDGTFTNRISKYFHHVSFASMGDDAADINNDGLVDLMTLEMMPSDTRNVKMMYSNTVFNRDELIMKAGYYRQYLRNCLQFNNGNGTFSDISFLLGISGTDWSWSPLFADFDNDGFKDLAIANGFPKNVTDKDYFERLKMVSGLSSNPELMLPYIPEFKSRNFFFKNINGQKFEDVSESWGIDEGSFSNGAAFVDLDNDGDLDYVTNNINQPAYLFKNNLEQQQPRKRWIRLKLKGGTENLNGIGSCISLYAGGQLQYYENYPCRGYISSIDPVIHFGLDTCNSVDSLKIVWPGGKEQTLFNLPADSIINLDINNAVKPVIAIKKYQRPIFRDITDSLQIKYKHTESGFIDNQIQPLLPHMHSREGPGLAVGDINGDHLDDVVAGNGRNANIELILQQPAGGFKVKELIDTADVEVTGILLFDADNDGDPDLYAVSGSSEFHAHSINYRDRLFINDGKGNFHLDKNALPEFNFDGSIVTACDYDRDGDLDLFVGGRMIPQSYPLPERSILLQNNHGKFKDVTSESCKDFLNLGMVTSVLWTDYDQDGWVDLLVAGEWMSVKLFKNNDGIFKDVSGNTGFDQTAGWWNSIVSIDLNNDGNTDYVIGNQGLNNRYAATREKPVYVIAKDFDNNGIMDPVMNAWMNGDYYPVHFRNDLIRQIPFMETRFPKYSDYSIVKSDSLFTKSELERTIKLEVQEFSSSIFINGNDGKFIREPLPFNAQFAPVKGLLTDDYNHDGNADVLLIGNDYTSEAFTGNQDALIGLYLEGNGKGGLKAEPATTSGFFVPGDGRSLVSLLDKNNNQLIFAGRNDDSLRVFKVNLSSGNLIRINPGPMDRLILIYFRNGSVQAHELCYASSWLSQTSRDFLIDKSMVSKIVITDFRNNAREITYSN